jgi:hypothetical protein
MKYVKDQFMQECTYVWKGDYIRNLSNKKGISIGKGKEEIILFKKVPI